MNQQQKQIPDGYWENALGALVPEHLIREIDKQRDQLVKELVAKAQDINQKLSEFKQTAFADIQAFVQLSAEAYDVSIGGKKGNVTLYSYDGRYKIQRSVADTMSFDERIQAAKALILECGQDWTSESKPEAKVVIDHAFAVDKNGNLSVSRILDLRRLDIKDPRWVKAMTAIGESLQVVGSKAYVRVYERIGTSDQYKPIPLDLAAVSL
ncbi:DUF3164 family protein [Rheinheimera aquimaris]|uniref:DUF3164 family protein n=1 Tax=Rheinheimera aquimaris TaxID=412437 RepID=UPI001E461F07|nr:DUF3164 family protein [Rheinheimera aquimaris]MCD1597893.1 DUF3164 family protein [Rheinheimera aquimaris]